MLPKLQTQLEQPLPGWGLRSMTKRLTHPSHGLLKILPFDVTVTIEVNGLETPGQFALKKC
jgi:hypothetical protein